MFGSCMILAAAQFPECSLIQSSASYWCKKPGIISTLPDGHVTRTHQPALNWATLSANARCCVCTLSRAAVTNLLRAMRATERKVRNVRYWHLADIEELRANVRFWGQSGHRLSRAHRQMIGGLLGIELVSTQKHFKFRETEFWPVETRGRKKHERRSLHGGD